MEDGAFESCTGTPQVPLLRTYSMYIYQFKGRWNDRKNETHTRAKHAHAVTRTLSLMTGAVRFTEQLWLLTGCGRWAGLSKATTVTFNLPNTHTHTHKKSHHHWHYNIFSAPHPACLITILSVGDWGYPRGNHSRASELTDLPLTRDPLFFSSSAYTPKVLLPSHLIRPRPRQAPAGHALMTSSRFSPLCI